MVRVRGGRAVCGGLTVRGDVVRVRGGRAVYGRLTVRGDVGRVRGGRAHIIQNGYDRLKKKASIHSTVN